MSDKLQNSYLHGHRSRLKARFNEGGVTAMADYEMLELLLMQCIPRKDVKPIAKELMSKFKNFSGVLNAEKSDLLDVDGVGECVVHCLKLAVGLSHLYKQDSLKNQDVIKNKMELIEYFYTRMSGLKHEEFHVVYLNSKNSIIHDECLFRGTVNSSAAYPREIIKQALKHGAASIVISHNHPSGDPSPSVQDEMLTLDIQRAAIVMDIELIDHIIIGDKTHYSFAQTGKL